jgi:SAM-dependent methyltransferase
MSRSYEQEIDPRLAPIVDGVVRRAAPQAGMTAIDLGCGTGSVALKLAVGGARVRAIDISEQMLKITAARASRAGFDVQVEYGRAEHIPALDSSCDILTASLSLMFVADKAAAAAEIARVLKPGGRFVAAAWGPPQRCDIVQFQRIIGQHGPEPPVPGVGPGSLADPTPFLHVLQEHGVRSSFEEEMVSWDHPDLEHAWEVLANVTASRMSPEQRAAAKADLQAKMWPDPAARRPFRNAVIYLVGTRG